MRSTSGSIQPAGGEPGAKEEAARGQLMQAQDGTPTQAFHAIQPRHLQVLHDLVAAISGVLEPEELARLLIARSQELLQVDGVSLHWWEPNARLLRRLGDDQRLPRAPTWLRPGQGASGLALLRREPVVVNDYGRWEHAVSQLVEAGVRSVLAVPLMAGDEVVGCLGLRSLSGRAFTAEHVQLVSLLAASVAPALLAVRLHAEVASSEQQLRSLYDTMACAVVVQGPGGDVLHANPAAVQILGPGLAGMAGPPLDQLWDLGDHAARGVRPPEPVLVARRTRAPVRNAVVRIERPEGERWIQADVIPLLAPDGALSRLVCSFVDITERRRAEEALRESEGRFRAIFEWSAMGIMRIALDGRILEVNPALREMLA